MSHYNWTTKQSITAANPCGWNVHLSSALAAYAKTWFCVWIFLVGSGCECLLLQWQDISLPITSLHPYPGVTHHAIVMRHFYTSSYHGKNDSTKKDGGKHCCFLYYLLSYEARHFATVFLPGGKCSLFDRDGRPNISSRESKTGVHHCVSFWWNQNCTNITFREVVCF